jgi:hypothetical protein
MSFTTKFTAQAERWEATATHATSAFNWGERFGLPGLKSLLPILLLWFAMPIASMISRNIFNILPFRGANETPA